MADVSTSQFQQGFPKYTFVHPISSAKLAMVPVVSGIIFTTSFLLAWFLFISNKSLMLHQYGILVLVVSGIMSWLQMIAWRLSKSPYLSTTVMLALVAVVFVLVVSSWGNKSLTPIIPQSLAIFGLVILTVSGFWLAINSIEIARTNSATIKLRFLSNVGFIGFNLPKHYHSISQALFRYEWRVFGWLLPMGGIFMGSVMLLASYQISFAQETFSMVGIGLISLVYLPWFLATEIAKSDLSVVNNKTKGLSSFLLSLPVSNFSIAMAKLKLASRSMLLFQGMVLFVANLIIFSLDTELCKTFPDEEIRPCFTNPWAWLSQRFSLLTSLMIVISANAVIPICAWVLGGNTLSWGLKGDKFFTVRTVIISVIGLMLIITFGIKMYSTESFRELLWSLAPIINSLVFIAVISIFVRALKKFLVSEVLESIKPAIIIAILLFVFLLITINSIGLITVSNPHPVIIIVDLMLLCMLPLLTSPFSIAKNRAR